MSVNCEVLDYNDGRSSRNTLVQTVVSKASAEKLVVIGNIPCYKHSQMWHKY